MGVFGIGVLDREGRGIMDGWLDGKIDRRMVSQKMYVQMGIS